MNNIECNIYWIRHGQSCANIHKKTHAFRFNPNLTDTGIQISKNIGKKFKENYSIKPDLVLSSNLKRTMETAQSMFPLNEIYSVPYIGELGKGLDNKVPSLATLKKYFNTNINLSYWQNLQQYTKLKINNKQFIPNYEKFINWLAKSIRCEGWDQYFEEVMLFPFRMFNKELRRKKKINIFIVTHSKFIKKYISNKQYPYNNSIWKVTYNFDYNKCKFIKSNTELINNTWFNINKSKYKSKKKQKQLRCKSKKYIL